MAANDTGLSADNNVARRRGYCDYPAIWSFDYVQSIKSEYSEGEGVHTSKRNKLKDKVRMMLNEENDPLAQLQNIDILQRLGVSYHFEDEIKRLLEGIHSTNDFDSCIWKDNLYATALKFRLLRQHQYSVPQEIFNVFKDDLGKFKECIGKDIVGLLSLYEASFLLRHGESILEEARDFTSKHLREFAKQKDEKTYISRLVDHTLEVPLHWRVPRLEARWFIDLCRNHEIINPNILELSILDYNIVQSVHQENLRELSRWWKDVKLTEKMNFFRDRMVEGTLWNIGMIFEPHHSYCRKMISKVFNLLTLLDDIYDVYGRLDELELLTAALESWDMQAMDSLPDYMKITFLAIYNFTNEVAYDVLKQQGLHIIKYLKKGWADVSKAYFQEAKWYHARTKPSFHKYMENAWVSISGPTLLVTAFFCVESPITEDALKLFETGYPTIVRQCSVITRLTNDLVTDSFEKQIGNVPTSVPLYMNEIGVSEDEARRHILSLVFEAWKQINEDLATNSVLSRTYIELVTNLTRMSMWIYDGRDGYGVHNQCKTKDYASSVFVSPIALGLGE